MKQSLSKLLFPLILYFITSCENSSRQNIILNIASIAKIDSMRWYYYSMNYGGKALFYDSMLDKTIEIPPVECDAVLNSVMKQKDSTYYSFSFLKPKMYFKYVDKIIYCSGILEYNHNVCPLFHLAKLDIQSNSDSLRSYINGCDSGFKKYLQNYDGKLSKWLMTEANKRKVFSNK